MSNDYATVADYKSRTGKTGASEDTAIQAYLDAAALAIDQYCNRPDGFKADATATARAYTGDGKPWIRIDATPSVTAVAVKDAPGDDSYVDWSSNDWIAFRGDPRKPDFNHTPYTAIMIDPNGDGGYSVFTSGQYLGAKGFKPTSELPYNLPTVQVTAKWGYAITPPQAIVEATIAQAAIWFKRGEAAWADTIGQPEFGEARFVRALDPAVRMMCRRYRRANIG